MFDLEAVEKRCQAATLGPCRRCRDTGKVSVKHGQIYETDSADEIELAYHDEECPQCEGFIAHARTDLPEAIAEIRRLREELERYAT